MFILEKIKQNTNSMSNLEEIPIPASQNKNQMLIVDNYEIKSRIFNNENHPYNSNDKIQESIKFLQKLKNKNNLSNFEQRNSADQNNFVRDYESKNIKILNEKLLIFNDNSDKNKIRSNPNANLETNLEFNEFFYEDMKNKFLKENSKTKKIDSQIIRNNHNNYNANQSKIHVKNFQSQQNLPHAISKRILNEKDLFKTSNKKLVHTPNINDKRFAKNKTTNTPLIQNQLPNNSQIILADKISSAKVKPKDLPLNSKLMAKMKLDKLESNIKNEIKTLKEIEEFKLNEIQKMDSKIHKKEISIKLSSSVINENKFDDPHQVITNATDKINKKKKKKSFFSLCFCR